tara:strand:- start:145 stop:636 length:492 start_codon:yes stop_codon:yes gene_type:complete
VSAGSAFAAESNNLHTGTATVDLQYVAALQNNGSAEPKYDLACKKQLSDPASRFVGMTVTTDYSINTKTGIMSAASTFPSSHVVQPHRTTVRMHPLGISSNYSFGAFKPSALPMSSVLFSIDKGFSNPVSTFLIINSNKKYNCSISSSPNVIENSTTNKLAVE